MKLAYIKGGSCESIENCGEYVFSERISHSRERIVCLDYILE
jgi:hypothetical protein